MLSVRQMTFRDRLPDRIEIEGADVLRKIVAAQVREDEPTILSILSDGRAQTVTLAPALTQSLLEMLRLISSGHGFRMIPVEARLTSQEAADLLNVSRPFLIKLLNEGQIPYEKIGRHRRIRVNDLFDYREKRDGMRAAALSELAELDADQGLL